MRVCITGVTQRIAENSQCIQSNFDIEQHDTSFSPGQLLPATDSQQAHSRTSTLTLPNPKAAFCPKCNTSAARAHGMAAPNSPARSI